MEQVTIYISDEIHCELDGPFESFEAAIAELRRCADIPWKLPPNKAPCTSWRTCGREYHVLGYEARSESARLLRRAHVLDVSKKGVKWIEGYERAWSANDP